MNYRLMRKDGKEIVVHSQGEVILNEKGETIGMMGVIHDITDLKKTEEALRESEERFKKAIIDSPHPTMIHAEDGEIIQINNIWTDLTGYTPEEIPTIEDWTKRAYGKRMDKVIDDVFDQNKRLDHGEFTIRTKSDKTIIWDFSSTPLGKLPDGRRLLMSIAKDVTERKQAEEALRESLKTSADLMNLIPFGIFIFQYEKPDKLILISGNPEAARLTGIKIDDWIGKENNEIWPEARKTGVTDSYLKVMETGKTYETEDLYYKDEKLEGAFRIRAFLLPGERLCVSFENIAERKKAEKKLITYQQNLRSLASELSKTEEHERQRIATYLHDQISQSLAVLRINIDELKEIKDYTILSEKADQIQSMLGNILKDSRTLTFDLSPPILHELGFEPAIEWIVEKMSEDFNISIEFENDAYPKPVDKDIGMFLYRSTKECLTNVVKHAQAHSIEVNIMREGNYLRIKIEDDGMGFETSILKSITHPVGFGLFSIRERIEYIGGNLLIESESGKGTKIIMSVPFKTS